MQQIAEIAANWGKLKKCRQKCSESQQIEGNRGKSRGPINFSQPYFWLMMDSCTDDMGLLIFMEYLANGSVENYMQKHRYISLELRRKWADQMTQALIYLHNRKPDALIHRDLKPANSC